MAFGQIDYYASLVNTPPDTLINIIRNKDAIIKDLNFDIGVLRGDIESYKKTFEQFCSSCPLSPHSIDKNKDIIHDTQSD